MSCLFFCGPETRGALSARKRRSKDAPDTSDTASKAFQKINLRACSIFQSVSIYLAHRHLVECELKQRQERLEATSLLGLRSKILVLTRRRELKEHFGLVERPLAQQGPPRRQGEEKALEDAAAAFEAYAAAALIAAGAAADDESPGPSAAADDDVRFGG